MRCSKPPCAWCGETCACELSTQGVYVKWGHWLAMAALSSPLAPYVAIRRLWRSRHNLIFVSCASKNSAWWLLMAWRLCGANASKHTIPPSHHIHIWHVSPQLSCGDTSQIWMWFNGFSTYARYRITFQYPNGPWITPTPVYRVSKYRSEAGRVRPMLATSDRCRHSGCQLQYVYGK